MDEDSKWAGLLTALGVVGLVAFEAAPAVLDGIQHLSMKNQSVTTKSLLFAGGAVMLLGAVIAVEKYLHPVKVESPEYWKKKLEDGRKTQEKTREA